MQSAGRFMRGSQAGSRRPGDSGGISLSPSTKRMIVTALVIFGLFAFVYLSATFWIQWWWFESVGYSTALTTRYISGFLAFLVAAVITGGILALNWNIALRRNLAPGKSARVANSRFLRAPLWLITIIAGAIAGVFAAEQWVVWRMALSGRSFGTRDAIYGLDAAFYVFRLPALVIVHRGVLLVLILSLILVGLIYLGMRGLDRLDQLPTTAGARRHLVVLGALIILVFGLGYLLNNVNLMYSTRGFVPGPGFTDVAVVRPINFLLVIISIVAALVLLFSRRTDQARWLLLVFGVWLAAVALGVAIPQVVQQTIVEPNELQRETPYIANNIAATRTGFGLDSVEMRNLSGQGEPPASALEANSPVLRNVRLWDYRVARQTYQQLQSFVPYYVFQDADVDRYPEEDALQQVLVAARELDINGLPANAQTWTNQHLSYTHGYAAVVSPINEATSQGLPVFTVAGIPPNPAGVMTIERPEIYFGEIEGTWVAVNTGVQEVTGIPGDTPPEPYDGRAEGSISLDNYLRRVILAIYLGDRRVFFTDELQPQSKVLLQRSIVERIQTIAPFLQFDTDPYLTIVDGRLIWVVDAYTATDRFPNATVHGGANYARNSFKVTIDAYHGTVTFYRTETPDPIADAYQDLFREMFVPISEASPELAEHFRYPEDLFNWQSEIFSAYHVTDPTAFYNGEDRWEIAEEQVEAADGQVTELRPMEAYYMTLPLPSETDPGFKLIRPFTPINRPNMTAWMAGQSDVVGNSRLVTYRFPRQVTVFGPQQVEARIDQDPVISSQFTLLSQAGSRVIRGNLLVLPVEETVMYVQPVYLQATASGGAPIELQFVIVATNSLVEMQPTLEDALQAIADADPGRSPNENVEGGAPGPEMSESTVQEALAAFDRGEAALQQGDWQAYGEAQAELQRILEVLAGGVVDIPDEVPVEPLPDAPVAGTPVP